MAVLVWITGFDHPFGIVGFVSQNGMAGISVEDRDDLGLGVGFGNVLRYELEMENACRQISFEGQASDVECDLDFFQFHRDIDMKRFFCIGQNITS